MTGDEKDCFLTMASSLKGFKGFSHSDPPVGAELVSGDGAVRPLDEAVEGPDNCHALAVGSSRPRPRFMTCEEIERALAEGTLHDPRD